MKRTLMDRLQMACFWVSGLFILLVLLSIIGYLIWLRAPRSNME
jgi:hypothetical protein